VDPSSHGNEVVDDLAKEGVSKGLYLTSHFSSLSDISLLFRDMAFASWTSDWEITGATKGKRYKQLQCVIPKKPWFSKINLPKPMISMLSRMRLGHCLTAEHLHKMGIYEEPYCECGLEIETLDHMFFVCPIVSDFGMYDLIKDIPRPFGIEQILTLKYRKALNVMTKFIKLRGLKI
jgi:hypothetical protein